MIRRQSSLRYLWWPPSSPRPATPSQRTKSPTATHHRPFKLGVVLWRCPLLRGAQLAPPLPLVYLNTPPHIIIGHKIHQVLSNQNDSPEIQK